MRHAIATLTVLAALWSGPALAEGAKIDKIRQLLRLTNAEAHAQQMVDSMNAQLLPMMLAQANQSGKATPEVMAVLEQEVRDEFSRIGETIVRASIPAYDRHFSEAELDDLIAFYQTPTGVRMVAMMPRVMQDVQQAGSIVGQQAAMRALERADRRLKDMGLVPRR